MAYFTQQLVNAITLGAIYGLIAIGYTMVYGIIELINFAHGDVFMVGTFMSLFFLASPPEPLDFLGLHLSGPIYEPVQLALVMLGAFAFGMTVMGLINVTIERFAYRPLRHAPRVAPLITAIGVSLILQQRSVSGSPTGAPVAIATMLDFASRHDVTPQTEHFPMSKINEAVARLESGKARYRIVLDADF